MKNHLLDLVQMYYFFIKWDSQSRGEDIEILLPEKLYLNLKYRIEQDNEHVLEGPRAIAGERAHSFSVMGIQYINKDRASLTVNTRNLYDLPDGTILSIWKERDDLKEFVNYILALDVQMTTWNMVYQKAKELKDKWRGAYSGDSSKV